MPYLIDRQRALATDDIVAVAAMRWRRLRSRVILKDNSLYQTLTRPGTLARYVASFPKAVVRAASRETRGHHDKGCRKGARWWK